MAAGGRMRVVALGERRMNTLLICGIAFGVAQAWLLGFGYAYHAFYLAAGAPEAPTPLLRWAIPAISFLFGAIGALVLIPVRGRTNHASAIFVCIVAITVLVTAGFLAGAGAAADQLKSQGFWGFLGGVLLCVYASGRFWPITQQPHAGDARNARA
jgi:hypothetical protein